MSYPKYREIDISKINHLLDGQLILLVTATDLETKFTHQKIKPLEGFDEILQFYDNNYSYFIGVFGNYRVAHVQCSMGSLSRSSSLMTVANSLKTLNSKVVIMIGIAFGVNEKKQNIGDVLVSETIIPYDIKRVGVEDTINRGQESVASQLLLNRIKNIKTWEYILDNGEKAKLIFTRLLSGEELIDNIERRNSLTKAFPDSSGGEMEGVGVSSACGNKIDWILVKGICDFADGEKGKNKSERQEQAILSALSLCLELFSSKTIFKELNIQPITESNGCIQNAETFNCKVNINDVLFDLYDLEKEKFYLKRQFDTTLTQKLNQFALWVYGPSGCGKSNLILRNLLLNSYETITVNLACCIGQGIESFFYEILYELESKTESSHQKPTNFTDCNKMILQILNKHYKDKEIVIFIEEIPIDTSDIHSEFAEKIFSVIISKGLTKGLEKIKFVLSSLEDPSSNLSKSQSKIHQHMYFLPLDYWIEKDILNLIEIIEKELNWSLNKEIKSLLIDKALGSPRFIKKFFRSIYALEKNDDETSRAVIEEIVRELNNN